MTKGEAIRIVEGYCKQIKDALEFTSNTEVRPTCVQYDAIKRLLQEVKRDGNATR